ncbi:hypothetical protein DSO57_1027329 [Entomophthora muscae]|uniref:Uncharacterized protein n=1 Tax=Entomophthora muscae TaxID=34485 RepID=A0ACC2SF27_9FUNG|nr:hypothetical protein DSO57_1027329 [Entomophthora muscae]
MSNSESSEVLSLKPNSFSFPGPSLEDKGYNITNTSLLKNIKERDFNSLRSFLSYFGQSQMLYCVRVGFWNKPSGVNPVEYVKLVSGVTKIQRKVAEHCFDVGFVSEKEADFAIKKGLFFKGGGGPPL